MQWEENLRKVRSWKGVLAVKEKRIIWKYTWNLDLNKLSVTNSGDWFLFNWKWNELIKDYFSINLGKGRQKPSEKDQKVLVTWFLKMILLKSESQLKKSEKPKKWQTMIEFKKSWLKKINSLDKRFWKSSKLIKIKDELMFVVWSWYFCSLFSWL